MFTDNQMCKFLSDENSVFAHLPRQLRCCKRLLSNMAEKLFIRWQLNNIIEYVFEVSKMEECELCGKKDAEYVLDDRRLCCDCYQREEKLARAREPILSLDVTV